MAGVDVTGQHALTVGGREVARYRVSTDDLVPEDGRRPYLHPVRTLDGTVVTDTHPADHTWHLGFSVAIPDVDGTNFWGGRSYLPADGYQPRDDHGIIRHERWHHRDESSAEHDLQWVGRSGEVLLHERRRVAAAATGDHWTLTLATTLRNATDRPIPCNSPGSRGRAAAGYGGMFWRLPPGSPQVTGPDRAGEHELNGATTPWLAVRTDEYALEFQHADTDPWFVRVADYPGVGTSFAWDAALVLPPGAALVRSLRVAVRSVR